MKLSTVSNPKATSSTDSEGPSNDTMEQQTDQTTVKKRPTWKRAGFPIYSLYQKYFSNDSTGWIVVKLVSELTEFTVQSIAFLMYNGFNPFDPHNQDNVYMAQKPETITVFGGILGWIH